MMLSKAARVQDAASRWTLRYMESRPVDAMRRCSRYDVSAYPDTFLVSTPSLFTLAASGVDIFMQKKAGSRVILPPT